jgi:putative endonuclease
MPTESSVARSKPAPWYVYMVRCADGTLYTGITTDLTRRLAEHNGPAKRAAKYTRNRRPVTLVYHEKVINRKVALGREAAMKKMPRSRKIALQNKVI